MLADERADHHQSRVTGFSSVFCRSRSLILHGHNVSLWPGPDRHLNQILPAGTAGGLSKPPLKAPRPQCRERQHPLQTGPPDRKLGTPIANVRYGAENPATAPGWVRAVRLSNCLPKTGRSLDSVA